MCYGYVARLLCGHAERAIGGRTTIKHWKDLRQEEMLGERGEQKLVKLKRH